MPLRPDRQIFCKVPARFFNRQVNEENAEPIVTHPHSRQFACIRGFVSISRQFAVENPSVNR
jgi:hypothetical protein